MQNLTKSEMCLGLFIIPGACSGIGRVLQSPVVFGGLLVVFPFSELFKQINGQSIWRRERMLHTNDYLVCENIC